MPISPDTAAAAAARLYEARHDRAPIAPLSDDEDLDLDVAGAYAVQEQLVARLLADGGEVVGHKLGLTSRAMRDSLGVDEPDYGPVLSSGVFEDGAALDVEDFIQPRIEAEIALVLAEPLAGPGATTTDAAAAVSGAVAALELVDSRIEDWDITLVDTIADLASSAAIVLGPRVVPVDGYDPRLLGMTIRRGGAVVDTGAGAAALGDPLAAVAWLANTLAPHGVTLEPGHVIMTGSLHAAFDVAAGDRIRADFDRLGAVTCSFM